MQDVLHTHVIRSCFCHAPQALYGRRLTYVEGDGDDGHGGDGCDLQLVLVCVHMGLCRSVMFGSASVTISMLQICTMS